MLLRREGWKANHKRVYRLYRQAGLNLRRKRPRRRKAAAHRLERAVLTAPNQVWSMDFVADALFDGRRLRALTVVDNFTKQSLAIEVDQQLKGEEVVAVMERLRHHRDLPQRIQTDNGSEFISIAMDRWAYDNGMTMDYSHPGKPTDDPFIYLGAPPWYAIEISMKPPRVLGVPRRALARIPDKVRGDEQRG